MPSNFAYYAVQHYNGYTLLFETISFYFVLQQMFETVIFLSYSCQQTP